MSDTKKLSSLSRPPIVVVLGHVNHGKTTLLDTIRKTTVAASEHGGITQSIGAYQIEVKKRRITFIDTPGHEAFSKMRSRGAAVADIAILVVASDDSVKPQTVESIEQIKSANIPLIVAVNKIDLPGANVDKVKSDLAKVGIQVEGFGGDVPIVPISAKAGTGVPELLDMILLVSDMHELQSEPAALLEAVVIETRVDKGKGMVASVIVKKGTLAGGKALFLYDGQVAKVRALFDDQGEMVREALPSKPVEVLGFTQLPAVGSVLTGIPQAGQITTPLLREDISALPDFLKPLEETAKQSLNIILKADTAGSLEAVKESLHKRILIVSSGIGDITDADIIHAKSTKSIIIGFNVLCKPQVAKLAQTEKVIFRTYTIIYELLQELTEVVEGLKDVATEKELGKGQVIAEFPYEKSRVAGTKVLSGRLARGDSVKIMRAETLVGLAKIKTMRRGKEDVTKMEVGEECGVLLDRTVDFALGDGIIAVTIG